MSDDGNQNTPQPASGASKSGRQDRFFFEKASDGMVETDHRGRIIDVNRRVATLTGYTREELLGMTFANLIDPEDPERDPIIPDDMRAGENATREHDFILKDGSRLRVEITILKRRGGRLSIIVRDMTGFRWMEDMLRHREMPFHLIMDNLTDMVAVLDLDGHRLYNSPSYHGLLGDPVKLRGSSSFEQVHPEDRTRIQQVFQETVRTGIGQRMEYRLVNQDGHTRYIESQGNVIRDVHGHVSQVVVVSRDVTERKLTEERLEMSERKYRELVEQANSIILRWKSTGHITFINEFGQDFFGYSAEDLVGRHVVGTIVPPTQSNGRDLGQLMDQICSDPDAFVHNVNENMRRNGERVWISWNNRIVTDAEGQVVEILSIGTDITERKWAEEQISRLHEDLQRHAEDLEYRVAERTAELVEARDRAEESDQLKSAFMATMSHELRTPLNSIIGFTGILLMGLVGPLTDEQEKQLNMVQDSAQHLLDLINDVLDISKIEAGQVELAHEPFDMGATIRKSIEKITPLAEKKGLAVSAVITPEDFRIVGDRRRVEQILVNLLSNAVKFTEQGKIRIESCVEKDVLVTRVIDTGIGIRPEDMGALFKPFRQIDTGITRQYEGTGLGLSICKRLVESMSGSIRVDSEWCKGSSFVFTLPLERITS